MKKKFIEPEVLRIELSMTENIALSGEQIYDIPKTFGLYHATFDTIACVVIDTYLNYNETTIEQNLKEGYVDFGNCFWFRK